uniref:(northern house mosquito) hypothetical protein n=1 Tax=Culex pipiens TaxID=7175 RepID=A0A8D8JED3_CULPI
MLGFFKLSWTIKFLQKKRKWIFCPFKPSRRVINRNSAKTQRMLQTTAGPSLTMLRANRTKLWTNQTTLRVNRTKLCTNQTMLRVNWTLLKVNQMKLTTRGM